MLEIVPTPAAETKAYADQYLAMGLFPLQLASPLAPAIKDGGWCKSPGKQPLSKCWQQGGTPEQTSRYRSDSNLGLRMGHQPAGVFLVCLDVDSSDLGELTKIAPSELWVDTLVAKTGRADGGYHFIYTWPASLPFPSNGVKLQGTKVDIRSEGGQIVVEPSVHPTSGLRYKWLNQNNIAELPIEIAQAILNCQQQPSVGTRVNPGAKTSAGPEHRNSGQSSVASGVDSSAEECFPVSDARFKTVIRRLSNKNSAVALAFESMLHGRPIAELGKRDDTITKMCWALAAELPNADPDSIAGHFQESLSLLEVLAPFAAPCDVAQKFRTALTKVKAAVPEVQLLCGSTGSPVACIHNVMQVLHRDSKMLGRFTYDLFGNRITIAKPLPWDRDQNHDHYPRTFEDEDVTHLAQYLMGAHRVNVSSTMIYETMRAVAKENCYHPVQEYFLGLQWDGVPRIDTWLRDYVDAEDTEVTRKISAWWLMSAFMRIADPGCQADYCLILEGLTGRGKSQAFKALAGRAWFSDSVSAFTSKDAAIDISGKWIIELAELSNFHNAKDVNVIKSFVTRTTDRHRPPYGKVAVDLPRCCVFAGTTNDAEYLQDTTGNRRFWPVAVGNRDIDIAAIAAVRDQLWAEAAVRVAAGEKYWPRDEAEREMFEREVDKRRVVDSAEDKVYDWLDNPVGYRGQNLTSAWLLENVLGIENPKRSDDTRLNAILRKVGFTRQIGSGSRYWLPPSGWVAPAVRPPAQIFALPTVQQPTTIQRVLR